MKQFFKDILESESANRNILIAGGVLTASLVTYGLYKKLTASRKKKDYPRDVVIVHGFGRGPYCPSLSPFVMKVETYLRINNIPHRVDPDIIMSPKGKVPWIEYNGEEVSDSAFILKWFNKKFDIDLDQSLNDKERGVSRCIRKLIEEELFWCSMMCIFVFNYTDNSWDGFGRLAHLFFDRKAKSDCWAQGIGRHSQEEVLGIMEDDVKALSDILGKQKFMMGNEVTEVDCTAFGFLCQLVWQSPNQPCVEWMKVKYPNLTEYCERMKAIYWQDWDECITHGLTREATK